MDNYEGLNLLKWPITHKMVVEWKKLDVTCSPDKAHDCGINSLSFFNLINKGFALDLSKLTNQRQRGISPKQLFGLITKHQKNKEFKMEKNIIDNNINLNTILEKIGHNYGTIVLLCDSENCNGNNNHIVIFAVNNDGQPVILDTQQLISIVGSYDVDAYLGKYKIIHFIYDKHSDNTINYSLDSLDPSNLIKKKTKPKTKKQQVKKSTKQPIDKYTHITNPKIKSTFTKKQRRTSPNTRINSLPSSFIDDMEKLRI